MLVVYYSLTGQTRRLAKKLASYTILEVKRQADFPTIDQPFVFISPTYEAGLEFLDDFLTINHSYLKGIIGSGNRNFDPDFCHTAKRLAHTYKVPLLHTLEFSGTPEDVEYMKGILEHDS